MPPLRPAVGFENPTYGVRCLRGLFVVIHAEILFAAAPIGRVNLLFYIAVKGGIRSI